MSVRVHLAMGRHLPSLAWTRCGVTAQSIERVRRSCDVWLRRCALRAFVCAPPLAHGILQYFAALGDLEIARLERQRMGDALAHAYTEVRACVRACVRG